MVMMSMISADELFSNGQIKPLKPHILSPLLDLEREEEDDGDFNDGEIVVNRRGRDLKLRSISIHRKARSLSPLRNATFQCEDENDDVSVRETKLDDGNISHKTTPSCSCAASSSRRGLKPYAHELHYTTNRAPTNNESDDDDEKVDASKEADESYEDSIVC
ncbi:unnamed protein product [Arabis nemorensis]|uniref:Uncharacterized protein n=1 Tax=Arabis nemorensis TaxID=586526 RepID=A0A565C4W8_9BRAS|nr:unnamed protein product [Arabis nemorensis]